MTELITVMLLILVGSSIVFYLLLRSEAKKHGHLLNKTCIRCSKTFVLPTRKIRPKDLMKIHYNFCNKCITLLTIRADTKTISYKEGEYSL